MKFNNIQELKDALYHKLYEVYDVFKTYYKEENTDLQNIISDEVLRQSISRYIPKGHYYNNIFDYDYTESELLNLSSYLPPADILVHWDKVCVKNEFDKYVWIWDLYAKVPVYSTGKIYGTFTLNRSTYTFDQFISRYLHSHIPRISYNYLNNFQAPCLGTGPIKSTIDTLRTHNDSIIWGLFCEELNRYVQTESIKGGPYIRLETIGSTNKNKLNFKLCYNYSIPRTNSFNQENSIRGYIYDFIKYYLQTTPLKFQYFNGSYNIGMSYYDYILSVSNSFIKFYNTVLCKNITKTEIQSFNIFQTVAVKNNSFWLISENDNSFDINSYIGTTLFSFKGQDVTLHVKDIKKKIKSNNYATILNNDIAMYILRLILLTLNYKYDNTTTTNDREETSFSRKNATFLF